MGEATTLPAAPIALGGRQLGALTAVTVAAAPAPQAAFELGELLGAGGMGKVVSARQTALDRAVAAKFLRTPTGDAAALIREAIVTGRLEHPNIVPVHLLATTPEGAPFFAMKQVAGIPWSDALAGGQPLVEALEVLERVCDAVAFAHSRQVLHRDIKPSNVLVGAFGEVYLVDWGLAVSLVPDTILPLASASGVGGTPAYMAPEMAEGDGAALTVRSDVYLLGATLYEVLTGCLPHDGPTLAETYAAAQAGQPPVFKTPVPKELAAICRKAMAKAPEERHPSAQAFKQTITEFLRHREVYAFFEQAQHRLVQLENVIAQKTAGVEGSVLGLTAHAAFSECRFGFEQVRRLWPEFEGARVGLQKALLLMAQHEVDHHDARAARILLSSLEAPPAELLAGIARVEGEEQHRGARLAELERQDRDREIDLVLGQKRQFALAFGVLVLVGAIAAQLLVDSGRLVLTNGLAVLAFGVPVLWSELLSRVILRSGKKNAAQQRLVAGLKVSAWGSVAFWSLAWAVGIAPLTAMPLYFGAVAINWLIAAVLFHPRGALISAASGAAAVLSVLFPRFTLVIGGACSFLGFAAMSWTQRRAARAARTF